MKKRFFVLPFLFLVALFSLVLASCSSESFGDRWIKAANDLTIGPNQDYFDEDYYKTISVNKAKSMIEDDETFLRNRKTGRVTKLLESDLPEWYYHNYSYRYCDCSVHINSYKLLRYSKE